MDTVRWGLIGCGDISRKRVAPALRDHDGSDFVCVARADASKAEEFAADFGARHWHADWRDLIDDPEIDAVYVATPVYLHAEQTIAAAKKGRHVLCEKPMGMNVAECDRMIESCRANGVKLGIAYYRHFYPVIDRVRAIIARGDIGRPVLAQIDAFEYFNPEPDHPRYWFMKRDLAGGGPMFDFGCHRIEVLLNLFGAVTSVRGCISRVAFDREVEDTATAWLSFGDGPRAVLNVTHASYTPRDTLDIYGTDGSIHISVLNDGDLVYRTKHGEIQESLPPHDNLHMPLVDDFVQAVLKDREPSVSGDTGREVNRIEAEIFDDWTFL